MSLAEGFGVGVRRVVGGGFPVGNKGKGEGGGEGGGWGAGKGTGKSMRKLCRNYPLPNYPLVSPQSSILDISNITYDAVNGEIVLL